MYLDVKFRVGRDSVFRKVRPGEDAKPVATLPE